MSHIPITDAASATRKVDVFSRTEGADTLETQAVAVVNPVDGEPIDFATQATVAALLVAASAIQAAAEALNTKATVINTGAVAGTVAVSNMVAAGVTDAQIRATPVPVSMATAPTTPVTGTFWQATQPVSGDFYPATQPVSASELTAIASAIKQKNSAGTLTDYGQILLAQRRDSDTPETTADGQYTVLKQDENGRLKVASQPASYADITGDITAIQATINTPVAGGTVVGDVSRASNVMAFCLGTFAGVNVTFEVSLEAAGENNWFGVQAVRSNANTIETATGALSAAPAYAWELSVNALARLRVRATARTSGTQSWRFKLGTYATEPIPAAQVSATQPVSGTVTANLGTLVTPTASNIISTAAANLLSVKASAGTLYHLVARNTGAQSAFLKLYNKASAPVVATDVPVITLEIAAGALLPVNFGVIGHRFATGIAYAITGAAGDTDATAVAAGQVKVLTSLI